MELKPGIAPATMGKICWRISVRRIGRPTAAHIFEGPAGLNGRAVVPLEQAGLIDMRRGYAALRYRANGCTAVANATIQMIASFPRFYYVNVHTARYPGGAVRGQLRR